LRQRLTEALDRLIQPLSAFTGSPGQLPEERGQHQDSREKRRNGGAIAAESSTLPPDWQESHPLLSLECLPVRSSGHSQSRPH